MLKSFQRGKEDSCKNQKDKSCDYETRNRSLASRYGRFFAAVPFGNFFDTHAAKRAPDGQVAAQPDMRTKLVGVSSCSTTGSSTGLRQANPAPGSKHLQHGTSDLLSERRQAILYFLNKLSNAARASLWLRGARDARPASPLTIAGCCMGMASRATVTLGENIEHSFD
jgi:hypothetical protein